MTELQVLKDRVLNLNAQLLANGHITNQVPDMELVFNPTLQGRQTLDVGKCVDLGLVYVKHSAVFLTRKMVELNMDQLKDTFHDVGRFNQPITKDEFATRLLKQLPK